jgi:hypothetical protein
VTVRNGATSSEVETEKSENVPPTYAEWCPGSGLAMIEKWLELGDQALNNIDNEHHSSEDAA